MYVQDVYVGTGTGNDSVLLDARRKSKLESLEKLKLRDIARGIRTGYDSVLVEVREKLGRKVLYCL